MKKIFSFILALAACCALFFGCSDQNPAAEDPNDKIVLKKYNMFINDKDSIDNSYLLGVSAPEDWAQQDYDLKFTDHFNVYQLRNFNTMAEGLNESGFYPQISLNGKNGEYLYGYLDYGSSNFPLSSALSEYYELFIQANNITPKNNKNIVMTSWTPTDKKIEGISFECEDNLIKERVIIFKTLDNNGKDCAFGVMHIGSRLEDYTKLSTLFDRMEKSIFGWGTTKSDREFYDSLYYYKLKDYTALGVKMQLPSSFDAFLSSNGYANSFSDCYEYWGNEEGGYHPDTKNPSGSIKVEIYRDPVKFSDVFEPITNLYALHNDQVSDLAMAPPRITKIDGKPAVYSIHNTYEDVFEKEKHDAWKGLYSKKVTRDIVYTVISGESIYTFQFTVSRFYKMMISGDTEYTYDTIDQANRRIDMYEEYFVFHAMDQLTFTA